jgi:hypothetical protein
MTNNGEEGRATAADVIELRLDEGEAAELVALRGY